MLFGCVWYLLRFRRWCGAIVSSNAHVVNTIVVVIVVAARVVVVVVRRRRRCYLVVIYIYVYICIHFGMSIFRKCLEWFSTGWSCFRCHIWRGQENRCCFCYFAFRLYGIWSMTEEFCKRDAFKRNITITIRVACWIVWFGLVWFAFLAVCSQHSLFPFPTFTVFPFLIFAPWVSELFHCAVLFVCLFVRFQHIYPTHTPWTARTQSIPIFSFLAPRRWRAQWEEATIWDSYDCYIVGSVFYCLSVDGHGVHAMYSYEHSISCDTCYILCDSHHMHRLRFSSSFFISWQVALGLARYSLAWYTCHSLQLKVYVMRKNATPIHPSPRYTTFLSLSNFLSVGLVFLFGNCCNTLCCYFLPSFSVQIKRDKHFDSPPKKKKMKEIRIALILKLYFPPFERFVWCEFWRQSLLFVHSLCVVAMLRSFIHFFFRFRTQQHIYTFIHIVFYACMYVCCIGEGI